METFTGYNEWLQDVSYGTGGDFNLHQRGNKVIAIDRSTREQAGVWDDEAGEGTTGQEE